MGKGSRPALGRSEPGGPAALLPSSAAPPTAGPPPIRCAAAHRALDARPGTIHRAAVENALRVCRRRCR